MLRRNIVLFIRKHKQKLIILLNAILLLIGISFIATIMISTVSKFNLYVDSDNSTNTIEKKQETIIYGNDIDKDTYTSDEELIERFIQYCNKGKIKEAYELLTDDCKQTYYSTEKQFKELYYQQIFYVEKIYEMQSWISNGNNNTYKIKLLTDMFDRGKYQSSDYIEEYYTVITENNEKKLSINKYINKVEINKYTESNNIKVNVKEKDIYMEYEIYTIEINNNTDNDIILDSRETTRATYLLDTSNVRYSSYIHELLEDDLLIKSHQSKTIKIKFNKMYNPDVNISSMEFIDIRTGKDVFNMSVNIQ